MVCLIAVGFSQTVLAADEKPNILVIISDDQGWMDIGYNGSEILTPNLDHLARTGIRLDANYVFTTCSPTRIALLAGRNPSRYGVLGPIGGRSKQALPAETMLLAKALSGVGYYTVITGKWHLGLRPEVGPRRYGFDSSYGYLHGQIDQYTHIYKNGDRTWHRDEKFIDEKGHATDLITDEAVHIIERKSDQPFFLYVAYSVPHFPLQEPKRWTAMYDGRIDDPDRKKFAASLTHMDAGIGRIVKALEQSGKRNNTLLIYTSDNGGQKNYHSKTDYDGGKHSPNKVLGNNRPFRGWKGDLYEGGIRVPALVNWPGKLAPAVVKQTVSVLDWYPTIAAYAGVTIPKEWELEGRNIRPLLEESWLPELQQRTLYWKTSRNYALRAGSWKLIEHRGKQSKFELFNLTDDPYEKTDLAAKHPEKLKSLKQQLDRQKKLDP